MAACWVRDAANRRHRRILSDSVRWAKSKGKDSFLDSLRFVRLEGIVDHLIRWLAAVKVNRR